MPLMDELTPMMRQYKEIKASHPDSILFFRLGDFYEMFDQDAILASKILNLTLTKRHSTPMCGIPYHASENYISRLLVAGKKIAVCEQVSEPGKGLVQRKVVEVLTPGTVVEDRFLGGKENNYLLSLVCRDSQAGLGVLDLSTGEFKVTNLALQDRLEPLKRELWRFNPKEILISEDLEISFPGVMEILHENLALKNKLPSWYFNAERHSTYLKKTLQVVSLQALGLQENSVQTLAAGSILEYLQQTSKGILSHIRHLEVYSEEDFLILDEATSRNLELVRNQREGTSGYTLLEVLDRTKTALGARRLRSWIVQPLKSKEAILARQEKVTVFYEDDKLTRDVRTLLSPVLDLERLTARLSLEKAHGRDLLGIKNTLNSYLDLGRSLGKWEDLWFKDTVDHRTKLSLLVDVLEKSLHPDPALTLNEGKLIRSGWNEDLDRLIDFRDHSQEILERYLEQEKQRSAIPQLKLKYNRIIGHFLEATKLQTQDIPSHFLRKQSLVGAERFTTEELMSLEITLNKAKDEALEKEKALFLDLRTQVSSHIPELQSACFMMAEVDVLQSLATVAWEENYTKPEIGENTQLFIQNGRHPVVEKYLEGGAFIPNDLNFDQDFRFCLLTGPNMAGKSTYLRQTALITLMAHMGSYVPATQAKVGLADRIFCRVGASDFLARGESTFLVEMNETAHILRNATPRSLVIMDEVGRGTSTHDGLAIAWAVSEYILNHLECRTLFATHFHELTLLEHRALQPFTMAVKEEGDQVIFLRKVQPGSALRSYGIYVAQLAGLPMGVLERAGFLLSQISQQEKLEAGLLTAPVPSTPKEPQLDLFTPQDLLRSELLSLDINKMTPLEALNALFHLQKKLK